MFQMGKALVTDSYFMTIYFGIDLHMNILYQFLRLLSNKWSFFLGWIKFGRNSLDFFFFSCYHHSCKIIFQFSCSNSLDFTRLKSLLKPNTIAQSKSRQFFSYRPCWSKTKAFPEHMLFNVTTFLFWCWFKLFRSLKGNVISPLSYLQIWNKLRALFKVWMKTNIYTHK